MGGRGSKSKTGYTDGGSSGGSGGGSSSHNSLDVKEAVSRYQNEFGKKEEGSYKTLNKNLREGKKLSKADAAIAEGLGKGMKGGDMETVYRGFGRHGHEKFLEAGMNGVVKDKAFVSTTRDTKIAKSFSSSGETWKAAILVHPKVGRIDVNKTVGHHSEFGEEKEVLLNKGTNFRITGINTKDKVLSMMAIP